ncbi:hypothetical protein [Xanthomonas citri]|uniref:hypothetical protein n=1 Tax=Xanthomonas citri TaxID=346 RepID=UPI0010401A13|nr:hypothetical protein [Xanthomonas citri]TBW96673.1 hypothetical protein TP49_11650 [Xanthomonas citri pv. aurantifolii]
MSGFIVSYDLHAQGQNYPCITGKLKELGAWHMQQSVWLVQSDLTATQLRDHLIGCLDSNDKLFVAKMTSAAWKTMGQEADKWIKSIIT